MCCKAYMSMITPVINQPVVCFPFPEFSNIYVHVVNEGLQGKFSFNMTIVSHLIMQKITYFCLLKYMYFETNRVSGVYITLTDLLHDLSRKIKINST